MGVSGATKAAKTNGLPLQIGGALSAWRWPAPYLGGVDASTRKRPRDLGTSTLLICVVVSRRKGS